MVLIVQPPLGGFETPLTCHAKTFDATAVAPNDYHAYDKTLIFSPSADSVEDDIIISTRNVFNDLSVKSFEVVAKCSFGVTLKSKVIIKKAKEDSENPTPHSGQIVKPLFISPIFISILSLFSLINMTGY